MPILAPGLVFVHLPKTGGTWTSAVLRETVGGKQLRGGHDPCFTVTQPERAGRVVFGQIRDPWSWYASLYIHAMNAGANVVDVLRRFGRGSTDFLDVLYGWTHPREVKPMPSAPLAIAQPVGQVADAFQLSGMGLWAWAVHYFYGRGAAWGVDVLIDTAHLGRGLTRLLNVDVQDRPRENTSDKRQGRYVQGGDYRSLYTDEALEWVHLTDGNLLQKFGLRPFAGGSQALHWLDTEPVCHSV